MKIKIKVKDFFGKESILEKELPDTGHLRAQQKYRATIYKDKTKIIPRKQKYKAISLDE